MLAVQLRSPFATVAHYLVVKEHGPSTAWASVNIRIFRMLSRPRKSTKIKIRFRMLSVPESPMFMADRDLGCEGVHTYVAT
jgi:hypothetical protein